MNTPVVGMAAPNFSLMAHDGSFFTLSDELVKHPVVLVFYTMAGTPNCDKLLCRINKDSEQFEHAGIKVVGINHADYEFHAAYADRKFLKMTLLSDDGFRVSGVYGSLFSIGPIKAIRYSVVGIGQDGLVKYYQRGRPSNREIMAGMGVAPRAARP